MTSSLFDMKSKHKNTVLTHKEEAMSQKLHFLTSLNMVVIFLIMYMYSVANTHPSDMAAA